MSSAYNNMKAIVSALGFTSNEKFEDAVGLGHGFVSRITNRVSAKSIQAILDKFPQVNPSFIRTGTGEMFVSAQQVITTTAKERLDEFLKYKGITRQEFLTTTGVNCNFPIIRDGGTFTAATSFKVNSKYPELNMYWLANGQGQMLQEEYTAESLTNYKERIRAFCGELGISVSFFMKKCGLVKTSLKLLPETPSIAILNKISTKYPMLNIDWIKTGNGNMLVNELNSDMGGNMSFIPLVPQRAYAGYLCGYADDVYVSALPTIPIVKEGKDKYVAFEVSGNSMDDGSSRAYQDGDIVICKECPDYMIKNNNIHYEGKEFIVVHREGILLKQITDLNLQDGRIKLHSFNPTYRDLELNLGDVRQILDVEYQQKRKK